jgi:hypothetical protein
MIFASRRQHDLLGTAADPETELASEPSSDLCIVEFAWISTRGTLEPLKKLKIIHDGDDHQIKTLL